jgi:Uma2 family endonuclease
MPNVAPLLSIDDFLKLPSSECFRELVRGRVIESKLPTPRHGEICVAIAARLYQHVCEQKLGRVVGGNAAVVTQRNPDCLRGPDIAFYSRERLPVDRLPDGHVKVLPDVVIDVLDAGDHWSDVIEKALEYLHAGVAVVCLADPAKESIAVLREGQAPKLLHACDMLELPEAGAFRLKVGDVFCG